MSDLYRLVGQVAHNNLITGHSPAHDVGTRTMRKEAAAPVAYPMGSILAFSSRDKKLVILGTQVQALAAEVVAVKGKYTITLSAAAADGDTLKLKVGGVEKTYTATAADPSWTVNNIAGDCTALQALMAADFPDYDVTKTATTVVLTQKVGTTEAEAVITVTQANAPTGLTAAVAETDKGVTHAAELPEEVLTPGFILAEDVTVTDTEDLNVAVYKAGCFSPEHVTVLANHVITAAEKDDLRKRNLVFKSSYAQ